MKTRNSMQLKAIVKNRAKKLNVSPQLLLQNYMLERLIDRISRSQWQDSIIVKGGMLIGSLIGVDRRTTKDLDTTVRNFTLSHDSAKEVFSEVCAVEIDDNLVFEFIRTENIREDIEYPGIRIFLKAHYAPLSVPLTIDVTTGDKITPGAIVYEYPFVFDEGSASIMAYPLETILAEKIETVLSRNVTTTRIRDFYDIYELWKVKRSVCRLDVLRSALESTCSNRNSQEALQNNFELVAKMKDDMSLADQWEKYASKHSYATEVSFTETLDALNEILEAFGL